MTNVVDIGFQKKFQKCQNTPKQDKTTTKQTLHLKVKKVTRVFFLRKETFWSSKLNC